MMHFLHNHLAPLIAAYGSLLVGVMVGLESLGLPLPGESALVSAAIYAGTTHKINIHILIASAAAGTVAGAIAGYWVGRIAGYHLALRYGAYIGITERRLLAGQYLFEHHGGKILFFSRFLAVLRSLGAILAGVNRMAWRRFLPVTVLAGVIWAAGYGMAAYIFGRQIDRFMGSVGIGIIVLVVLATLIGAALLHRHGTRLERQLAVRARRSRRGKPR